jgi:hypothetical protein
MGLAALGLHAWLRDGGTAELGLGLAAAILAALTKNEGLLFLAGFATVAIIAGRRRLRGLELVRLAPLVALLVPLAGWRMSVAGHGYRSHFLEGHPPTELVVRAGQVVEFAFHLLDIVRTDYGWVLLAGLVAVELAWITRSAPAAAILALAGLQALGYLATYVVAPFDVSYYLNTSADRLTVQLLPVVMVALLAALASPDQRNPTSASRARQSSTLRRHTATTLPRGQGP